MKSCFRLLPEIPDIGDPDLRALAKLIMNPVTGPAYRKRFQMVTELCDLPSANILELGFGSGFLAYSIAPSSDQYLGVDLHNYPQVVEDNLKSFGIHNIDFFQGDARNIERIPSGSIDLVVSVSCLEHIKVQDQVQVQEEVIRVLKPGCSAVYGMPIKNFLTHFFFRSLGYNDNEIHPSVPRDTILAARQCGLTLSCEKFYPFFSGHKTGVYWAGKFKKIALVSDDTKVVKQFK